MTRIAVCGEVYSSNLGDGMIADSLKWLLNQADESAEILFVDLSGREGFASDEPRVAHRQNALRRVHQKLAHQSVYRKAASVSQWHFSGRNQLRTAMDGPLRECDFVVIGGGQLLMDNALSFPLRTREIVKMASRLRKNVAFHACGVGAKWSMYGSQIVKDALFLGNVSRISVRDSASRDTLKHLFPSRNFDCSISVDPAVCAAEAYGVCADVTSSVIGLGVSAPISLRRHAGYSRSDFTVRRVKRFWMDLADRLVSKQREFLFFTNGQADDYAFAASIVEELFRSRMMRSPLLLERPRKPRELIAQVARCKAIVAHRLHANVAAYSLGVPSVGLIWDRKVREFGRISKREEFYLDSSCMGPSMIDDLLQNAILAGVDSVRQTELKSSAIRDAKSLIEGMELASVKKLC